MHQVQLALQGHQDQLELQEGLDRLVSQDHKVEQEPLEPLVPLVLLARVAYLETLGERVSPGPQVRQVRPERLDLKVPQDQLVQLVCKGIQEVLDR